MYRIAGLESALRADMPRSMMDELDKNVINGGAAPSFVKGIPERPGRPDVHDDGRDVQIRPRNGFDRHRRKVCPRPERDQDSRRR